MIKDSHTQHFMADVIEASREQPVIVDFWAPWCGPCQQLGPALEQAVNAAGGAVRLVKINIDENPQLARQLRIQSIPAVFAFVDGQPVDGFAGALPESQIKAFVERLAGRSGPDRPRSGSSRPKQAAAAGQPRSPPRSTISAAERARNPEAHRRPARCQIASGGSARAREALAAVRRPTANARRRRRRARGAEPGRGVRHARATSAS